MADFLRPEARATLWRWRDVILAVGVTLFGAWWLLTFFSPVQWLGYGFVGLGILLGIGGWQRVRFRSAGDGPGVVKIVERRLAYFGPLTGGVIDLADVSKLELEPQALPAPHWVLTGEGGQILEIPVNADGADALFDAFASLDGIRTDHILAVLERTPDERVTVWSRVRPLLH